MHICAVHAAFISPRSKKALRSSHAQYDRSAVADQGDRVHRVPANRVILTLFGEKLAHIFSKHFLLSSLHFNRILTSEL